MTTRLIRRTAMTAPVIVLTLLSACSAAPPGDTDTVTVPVTGSGTYTDVTAGELNSMLAAKDFTLVNVHVPYEGEISDTDLFIPFDQMAANLGQLPTDRTAKIILYCRSGSMSAIAARELVAAGYTDVGNLDGGMNAWEAQGYPLEG